MDYILAKQTAFGSFAGHATELQQTMLAEWLQVDSNRELYFGWLEEWERHNPQFLTDTNAAYQHLLQARQSGPLSAIPTKSFAGLTSLSKQTRFYWLVAASVLLVLSVGVYLFQDQLWYKRYQTGYGEIQPFLLDDGSRITLNANSVLRVPRFGYGQTTRNVWLTGEAEFSVRHLRNHQRFIVHTPDQLEVQVLGTEFIVYSRERGSKVVLTEGSVQLHSARLPTTRPLLMAPGDVVTMYSNGHLIRQPKQLIAPHIAWKYHSFILENTTVNEIVYRLNEQYGIQVTLTDSTLANRRLGGTYPVESADEFLQVLADILNAQLTQYDETTYRISPL